MSAPMIRCLGASDVDRLLRLLYPLPRRRVVRSGRPGKRRTCASPAPYTGPARARFLARVATLTKES